jgi:uncharacterized membrane protein YgcG
VVYEHDCGVAARPRVDFTAGDGVWRQEGSPEYPCAMGQLLGSGLLEPGIAGDGCVAATAAGSSESLDERVRRDAHQERIMRPFPMPVRVSAVGRSTDWSRNLAWILTGEKTRDTVQFILETEQALVPTLPIVPTAMLTPPLYAAFCEGIVDSKQRPGRCSAVTCTADVVAVYRTIAKIFITHALAMGHSDTEASNVYGLSTDDRDALRGRAHERMTNAAWLSHNLADVERECLDDAIFDAVREGKEFAHLRERSLAHAQKKASTSEASRRTAESLKEMRMTGPYAVIHETAVVVVADIERLAASRIATALEAQGRDGSLPSELEVEASPRRRRRREASSSALSASSAEDEGGGGGGGGGGGSATGGKPEKKR